MWEILSGGKHPYFDLENVNLSFHVCKNGCTLDKTHWYWKRRFDSFASLSELSGVVGVLWPVMKECWNLDPEKRSDFGSICEELAKKISTKSSVANYE